MRQAIKICRKRRFAESKKFVYEVSIQSRWHKRRASGHRRGRDGCGLFLYDASGKVLTKYPLPLANAFIAIRFRIGVIDPLPILSDACAKVFVLLVIP